MLKSNLFLEFFENILKNPVVHRNSVLIKRKFINVQLTVKQSIVEGILLRNHDKNYNTSYLYPLNKNAKISAFRSIYPLVYDLSQSLKINLNNTFISKKIDLEFGHPYHLVPSSQLPPFLGFSFFLLALNILFIFRGEFYFNVVTSFFHIFPLINIGLIIIVWFNSIFWEEFDGNHTLEVQQGFRYAIILFILSELMLFVSFFWGFFHFALSPSSFIGGFLVPEGVIPFLWYRIPLLNTCLLLASGASLTVCHITLNSYDSNKKSKNIAEELANLSLEPTVSNNIAYVLGIKANYTIFNPTYWLLDTGVKGIIFLTYQVYEYVTSLFNISDSVFGAIFYSLTGLHGIHVFIGVVGLFSYFIYSTISGGNCVLLSRSCLGAYTLYYHRVGFDASAWYWHFVDVVWFFVFIYVYWWVLVI